jgi:hypothetical protein
VEGHFLDQARIAFSDFSTYAQYWYRCLRAAMCDRLWGAVTVDSGCHVAMMKMTPNVVTLLHFKSTFLVSVNSII